MTVRLCALSLVFVAATLAVCRVDAQTTELVGTWRLVSAEDHLPGGKIAYPFGEHAVGTIIYDPHRQRVHGANVPDGLAW